MAEGLGFFLRLSVLPPLILFLCRLSSPLVYPIPSNANVEGSYLNCPDSICGGDRHVLVIDNSTCMLYGKKHIFHFNDVVRKIE